MSKWEDDSIPFISVSFPLEFSSSNQPYPHLEPHVLSPKPAAVDLLEEDLQMLGFW